MGNQRDLKTSSHFTPVIIDNAAKVRCKHCHEYTVTRHIPRMKKHLMACKYAPASVKAIPTVNTTRCPSSASQGSAAGSSASMDDQVVKLSRQKVEEMKELGALFIFTSGASFNVSDNKHLRRIFKETGLPMLIPERHLLSSKYLPLLYQRVKHKNEQKLKGKRHRLISNLIPASIRC